MSLKKSSLLKRYDIPISHLDFDYVKSCTNSKEIERILRILYSGEEGYFPDLIACTENKLRELKPDSKWLRTENRILNKNQLDENERNHLSESFIEWYNEIKIKDTYLNALSESNEETNNKNDDNDDGLNENLYPIRGKNIKINYDEKILHSSENSQHIKNIKSNNSNRIKSIDYNQWDKYDADTEILKIDLKEEKIRENNEIELNRKVEKIKNIPKQTNQDINDQIAWENLERMSDIEKENFANKFKEAGNDYYRAREYENAIKEYTKSIKIFQTSNGYNNRAIAFLKLEEYQKCIDDCDCCLAIDPKNIKALLRKAQALQKLDKKEEAYEICSKIVSLEPQSTAATNILNSFKKDTTVAKSSSSPALNTTRRIRIIETPNRCLMGSPSNYNNMTKIQNTVTINNNDQNNRASIQRTVGVNMNSSNDLITSSNCNTGGSCIKKITSKSHTVLAKNDVDNDDDLSKLIIPNRIIKSGVERAVEKLDAIKRKNESEKFSVNSSKRNPYLELNLLPINTKNIQKNNVIQEI